MTPARRRRAWPAVHGVAHKCTQKRVIGQRLCSPGQYQGRAYGRMCINGLKSRRNSVEVEVTDRKPAAVRRLSLYIDGHDRLGVLSININIRRTYVPIFYFEINGILNILVSQRHCKVRLG